jgi:hypothetical protein
VQFIAVPALLAGLATNRTVVFINNARADSTNSRGSSTSWVMRKPWSLASCYTPRRDHQCFFAPLSPCVPTDQDLSDAVALNKTQKMQLFQDGILPEEYQNEKFVYMLGLQKFPNASLGGDKVQKAVHRIVHYLIDQHEFHAASSSNSNQTTNGKVHDAHFMSLLRRAADRILHQEIDGKKGESNDDASVGNNVASAAAPSSTSRSSPRFHYRFDNSRIHHALALYALRPNESNQQKLQRMLRETLERHQHAHPDHPPQQQQQPDIHFSSVGLPVRASDKCLQESECLSLEQYMWAVRKAWHTFGPNVSHTNNGTTTLPLLHPPTIIFTTESTDMQEAQRRFVANQRQEQQQQAISNVTNSAVVAHHYQDPTATSAAAWTMMTNDVDVTPDSGRFKPQVALERNVTAEEAMLSAISTLRLQLLARVTVGNCCSNFHTLLRNLFMEGCGTTREHYFHCLQDDDEPELRMCCFKSKSCIAQREKEIRERQNRQDHASLVYV